jgi:hypothetical protein
LQAQVCCNACHDLGLYGENQHLCAACNIGIIRRYQQALINAGDSGALGDRGICHADVYGGMVGFQQAMNDRLRHVAAADKANC